MTVKRAVPASIRYNGAVYAPWILHEAIDERTTAIATYLANRYRGQHIRLVFILKGGRPFGQLLHKKLAAIPEGPASISTDQLRVKSYDGLTSRNLRWHQVPRTAAREDVHDILIDDIADTAKTLAAVEHYLQAQGPASLITVVLLDRPEARAVGHKSYKPTVVGFRIKNPTAWAIGFGLDLDEGYRELPDIYGKVLDGKNPEPCTVPRLPRLPH